MRSSSGQHFLALDHVRGVAAFLVINWHFTHSLHGFPVPFGAAPELGPLDEGHVGVSLFMTLSGYLFAKLLDGKDIRLTAFLWNRFIRLAPLLTLVFFIVGAQLHASGGNALAFFREIPAGLIFPVLPNGAWSITTELHFYVLLPLLLPLLRHRPYALLVLIGIAVATRLMLHFNGADVPSLAYRTLVGRFDQFVLGMLLFRYRSLVEGRTAAVIAAAFWGSYAAFDLAGGFYNLPLDGRIIWVLLPTWEAACLGVLIAWYDKNVLPPGKISWALQKAGEYSYSIYLLHFFFYEAAARAVHLHIMPISSLYMALPWALLFFALMMIVGHFSYRLIERPFLAYRLPYVLGDRQDRGGPAAMGSMCNTERLAALQVPR